MQQRIESDSFGKVSIPADRYYGPQTQRSLEKFRIGSETFPAEFIHCFAILKKAAAEANRDLGLLDEKICNAIAMACDEIAAGKWDDHFPLVVWQTGSGTQTHMNLNEVIAHRAKEIGTVDVDAHDHVNMSQSTNDVFSTAMHCVAVERIQLQLLPAVEDLRISLQKKSEQYQSLLKLGRTHLMDAVPMTFGQELSAYAEQLRFAEKTLKEAATALLPLPLGGTAIGTGLNAHAAFAEKACRKLQEYTGLAFVPAENKFALISAHDPLVHVSSCLKILAVACMKIGNDLRLLSSGPRGGFGELHLPANEPGSSIMPGKVNPTQIEALMMVAVQVIGNDLTISFAGSQGQLELNVFKPLIAYNLLQSIRLLTDACASFRENCVEGMKPDEKKMRQHLDRSLMLVTALSPLIGYDKAASLANYALEHDLTLKDAAQSLHLLTHEAFDRAIRPEMMIGPSVN